MIAVTGANGLLGSFLVRKLHATNTPFVALKRTYSDTSQLRDLKGIEWREADILDPHTLEDAFAGVTGVIHNAGMVSFNPRDKKKLLQVNVEGTKNIVDICLDRGIERLLHISSVSALGRQKDQVTIDESNQWQESSYNTLYAESKYKAELEVFRGQEEGLRTVMVNPSVILGPGDWTRSSSKLFKYVWDEQPFYADGSLNVVDVRDVAEIVYRLYRAPISGERFILNAGTFTIKEFMDKTAALLQKRAPRFKVSRKMLEIVAHAEAFRSLLTGSEPLITKETARVADTTFRYENQKVTQTLKYHFQPIETTLRWCTEFYRKQTTLKN
jgi:dihydroflavonol-4-reductase